MSQHEMKAIYQSLLDSGDLMVMFPDLSGEWEQDEAQFSQLYDMNEQVIEDDFDLNEDF